MTYLPVVVTIAAVALTYLFCIRPMRRGQVCFQRRTVGQPSGERSRELELARTELERLRLRQREREQSGTAG